MESYEIQDNVAIKCKLQIFASKAYSIDYRLKLKKKWKYVCHCVLSYGQKFNFASQRDKSETTLKEIAIHFLNKIGDSNYLKISCIQDMNTFTILKNMYIHIVLNCIFTKITLNLCWKYSSLFPKRNLIDFLRLSNPVDQKPRFINCSRTICRSDEWFAHMQSVIIDKLADCFIKTQIGLIVLTIAFERRALTKLKQLGVRQKPSLLGSVFVLFSAFLFLFSVFAFVLAKSVGKLILECDGKIQ